MNHTSGVVAVKDAQVARVGAVAVAPTVVPALMPTESAAAPAQESEDAVGATGASMNSVNALPIAEAMPARMR